MKQNLWLFTVLVALITGTYFFQEKRVEEEFKKSLVAGKVITEEITAIETPYFRAEKVNQQWKNGDDLLSHNDLHRLVKMLESINEIKKLEETTEVSGIDFKVNNTLYTIGDLNLDKSGFYFKKQDSVYVAIIDTDTAQIHSHDDNLNELKLEELKSFFNKTNEDLLEKQLFRYYSDLQYESVAIRPDGALDFEIDFKTNSTLPAPMKGIEVHEDLG
ncbi:MAG TPA: hypothetical protein VKZ84_03705, partial [Bacteriovoracaceae bacterium]|nr:hypothetical protein [Bacteriovoracaceae bacterium]